ncbi:acyl carrier protein [Amycolatopsis dendrobii]|uniref:Acyl carrier protein n=1 Tax=Amycolatopsis dendrobii TaxID=2760662 RepID=A0A7W3W4F9_9PSEU|nr:acyl carrier protein [Amycolatopsis dendrobii]MBB1158671.1 acyl carrier protein [Amycolatopsis dendrobii]
MYADADLVLVAALVADALASQGLRAVTARELIADPELCTCDLARFGLGSLDWIALATRLERQTGVELPDGALLDDERRSIAGWATALTTAGSSQEEQTKCGKHSAASDSL